MIQSDDIYLKWLETTKALYGFRCEKLKIELVHRSGICSCCMVDLNLTIVYSVE